MLVFICDLPLFILYQIFPPGAPCAAPIVNLSIGRIEKYQVKLLQVLLCATCRIVMHALVLLSPAVLDNTKICVLIFVVNFIFTIPPYSYSSPGAVGCSYLYFQ